MLVLLAGVWDLIGSAGSESCPLPKDAAVALVTATDFQGSSFRYCCKYRKSGSPASFKVNEMAVWRGSYNPHELGTYEPYNDIVISLVISIY